MAITVMNTAALFGLWLRDSPGSGLLRQSFTITVAGRATELVGALAWTLSQELDWAKYGKNVFPWSLPFGLGVPDEKSIPVGGVLIRPGLATSESYTYSDDPDQSEAQIDILMQTGSDWIALRMLYTRMSDIEKAISAMRATVVESPPEWIDPNAPPVAARSYSRAYGRSYS